MRFKLTIRGEGFEVRGYIDADHEARLVDLSNAVKPFGLVIASIAPDYYQPFGITDPDNPPTPAMSTEQIKAIRAECEDEESFITRIAWLHFSQASVIRGERFRYEQAESELMARELHHMEVEQENEHLKAEVAKLRRGR